MSVEKYHQFLKKMQAIVSQDKGTYEVFLHDAKTSQYAFNSDPINDTDNLRIVAVVGQEFRF